MQPRWWRRVQGHGGLVVAGLKGQPGGEGVGIGGKQYQLVLRASVVKLQELAAGLDDGRELELQTDERSRSDLFFDRRDRFMQAAEQVVVEPR